MPDFVYNKKNAVTASLQSILHHKPEGQAVPAVEKVLNQLNHPDTLQEWRASDDQRHWNYWRREYCVYTSLLDQHMQGSGVRLPKVLEVKVSDDNIRLVMEKVTGVGGTGLGLEDYATICRGWGAAQAMLSRTPLLDEAWTSRQFLRAYTGSKPVRYELLDDAQAWQAPLIADNWPDELREGLQYLYHHREQLYGHLERAVQLPSHLDFWPNNVFIDSNGEVVLIDWGFFGQGAIGEDLGNFIPDAVFDGFMPVEKIPLLQSRLLLEYERGIRAGGLDLDADQLRHNMYASAVKYVWLGPLLLANASSNNQLAYGGVALEDANEQYWAGGQMLLCLCGWAQEVAGASGGE